MREDWLPRVVQSLQVAVGATILGDPSYIQRTFMTVIDTIDLPETAAERLALRSLLLEFALRGCDQIHARFHRGYVLPCSFQPEASVLSFFKDLHADPRPAFHSWLGSFFEKLKVAHPLSGAEQVAEIIRRDHANLISTVTIARQLRITPVALRRAFRSEFDSSVRTYLERVRIASAMRLLERGVVQKIESVARDVGYRSKKNFYQAFHRHAGMTPAEFRGLPPETRQWIVDSVARDFCPGDPPSVVFES